MKNEEKAAAIMGFLDLIVGAKEANFIDSETATIAEFYQVARNHCKDAYGVMVDDIETKYGADVARICGAKL